MPVSVVVGGQYGSEGKGKVAHFFAKKYNATAVVRVGGPNSGHTVINEGGQPVIFKQLPTACIMQGVKCVLTAGNYINVDILQEEISVSGIDTSNLIIDPFAVIITNEDVKKEELGDLINRIGSTGCGLGSAIHNRIARNGQTVFAKDIDGLKQYIGETNNYLRGILDNGKRVIIEGTQGFGLSVLHSGLHPYCTSRDTTAAGFLSEAGLSPLDVDDIILVIRTYPIRVAGNSGPLKNETSWETVSNTSGSEIVLKEYTSVTKKVRRIAPFDGEVVQKAISYNQPTKVVLNHLDYVDSAYRMNGLSPKMISFLKSIELSIRSKIDYVGINRSTLIQVQEQFEHI